MAGESTGLIFGMRKGVFWYGLAMTILSLPVGWFVLNARPKPQAPTVFREAPTQELPILATLPSFSLTDQDGQPFTTDRMRGKIWIANFMFTTCPSVCPLLSQKMATIHEKAANLGNGVQLVSFTVDPETDTPLVLKEYRARYTKDPARWTFVTGTIDAIEAAVEKGFKVGFTREKKAVEGKEGAFDIVHGELFVLVDAVGQIRGFYQKDDADQDRLLRDAARLASSGTLQAGEVMTSSLDVSMSTENLPPEEPAQVIRMDRGTRSQLLSAIGMLLFLFSWGLTFAGMFVGYIILWWRAAEWPPPGTAHLSKTLPLVNTAVAVASSLTFELAVRAARRSRSTSLRGWMSATFVLGALFIALQYAVWTHAKALGIVVGTSNYAGMFYAMTYFHAAHVACGLLFMIGVVPGILRNQYNARSYAPLKFGAWFWHFVTAAWFCIFFLVYML